MRLKYYMMICSALTAFVRLFHFIWGPVLDAFFNRNLLYVQVYGNTKTIRLPVLDDDSALQELLLTPNSRLS